MPSIQTTLQSAASLNSPEVPYVFTVEGDTLVGKWDITNSRWFAPAAIRDTERDYKITVTFDETKGTYKTSEETGSFESYAGIGGVGGSYTKFKGTVITSKSFERGIGGEKSESVGVNDIRFDVSQIKNPLNAFLEQQGWKKQKGFFASLFGG